MIMETDILSIISTTFKGYISNTYPFPNPFKGKSTIKAIVLGADPTHIVNGNPIPVQIVFGLNNQKSPYWRRISKNLSHISNLTLDNLYVQNLCQNYFTCETGKNKCWTKIAREYWIPVLKLELDNLFPMNTPVLMTTEFILKSCLNDPKVHCKAEYFYTNCRTVSESENLLERELIPFYRHPHYSLNKWQNYKDFIQEKF